MQAWSSVGPSFPLHSLSSLQQCLSILLGRPLAILNLFLFLSLNDINNQLGKQLNSHLHNSTQFSNYNNRTNLEPSLPHTRRIAVAVSSTHLSPLTSPSSICSTSNIFRLGVQQLPSSSSSRCSLLPSNLNLLLNSLLVVLPSSAQGRSGCPF